MVDFKDFDFSNWISFVVLYPFCLFQLLLYSFIFAIEVTKNSVFGKFTYSTMVSEEEFKQSNYEQMKQLIKDVEEGESK